MLSENGFNDPLAELAMLIGQSVEDQEVFVSRPDADFSVRRVPRSELDAQAARIHVYEGMRAFGRYRPWPGDAFFPRPWFRFDGAVVRDTSKLLKSLFIMEATASCLETPNGKIALANAAADLKYILETFARELVRECGMAAGRAVSPD